MTYVQPNRSPESCRAPLCGYLEQRNHNGDHHDRCMHGIPMHGPGCGWHRTPEQIRAMHERDAELIEKAKQPIQRRGP